MMEHLKPCPFPDRPGRYICQRHSDLRPELVEIRQEINGLYYIGYISTFPLSRLKGSPACFYGPVELDETS